MEGRLTKAAIEGNVNSMLQLLQEDTLLLDRFITNSHPETPLHIASMFGHVHFVHEILVRKPELAKELDSRRSSSPLHLATAKGYIEIVKDLLSANPEMCFVCDQDGRNPVHIAALKGHLDVLRELIRIRPGAARVLMDRAETILHACVRHNQFESMKVLLATVSDHEFVNFKDFDGNTVLHFAIANKQFEVVKYLVVNTTIEVNSTNTDGLAPLDLLSLNRRDLKEKEISEFLGQVGATNAKAIPLSKHELQITRKNILATNTPSSTDMIESQQKDIKKQKKKLEKKNKKKKWCQSKKESSMVVASLLATMAFQAGLTPPGGFWQDTIDTPTDNHTAGYSILSTQKIIYTYFLSYNTTGLVASLSIILLSVSGIPLRNRFCMWFFQVILWVAILAMASTYLILIEAYTPEKELKELLIIILISGKVWVGLMLLILVVNTIMLMFEVVRFLYRISKKMFQCSWKISYSGSMVQRLFKFVRERCRFGSGTVN